MSIDYSDSRFDAAVEEIEKLLGDLYGIEAVSRAIIDYAYAVDGPGYDQAPGSGFLFKQLGSAISAHIDQYADKIPVAGDLIVATLIKKGLKKLPYSAQVIGGYKLLTALEANDTDELRPKSADALMR